MYVPPSLVQQIVKGKPLPFFKAGVTRDPRLAAAADALLNTIDAELDPLAEDDVLYRLVITLAELAGQPLARTTLHFAAAARAREYIDDNLDRPITLDDLADCAGRDRWSLSNDFRMFFGTSPHRYLTLRRLDRVKRLAQAGQTLSDAAIEAGFFIVADLPFMSYATTEQALQSSGRLMKAGAHMVKLEGDLWLAEPIRQLAENGVPVCAHLGLTPQSVNVLGGFNVQGRDFCQVRGA